jgi:hypothetical protein
MPGLFLLVDGFAMSVVGTARTLPRFRANVRYPYSKRTLPTRNLGGRSLPAGSRFGASVVAVVVRLLACAEFSLLEGDYHNSRTLRSR